MNFSNSQQTSHPKSICFTNFICNKSFCRSATNCKFNILINKNATPTNMIKDILKNKSFKAKESTISNQSLFSDIYKILREIKENFRSLAKDDFKNFFVNLKSVDGELKCIDVSEVTKILLVIIEKVVPAQFYGCNKNKKVFFNLIRFIMKGMLHQHVTFERIVYNWDVEKIPWFNGSSSTGCKVDSLCKVLIWLIKNTVCSIVAVRFYVTVTKMSHEMRKLYFYCKEDWQRMNDNFISGLLKNGDIVKCDSFSLGSQCKSKLPSDVRSERKFFLKRLPVMRLMLKSNSSVRVIIRYKKLGYLEKNIIKKRRNMFKCIFPNIKTGNFDQKYVELASKWKMAGEPKLYFVKADLADAFGSVDVDHLRTILAKLHNGFQRNEKCLEKKKMVAKEYQKLIADLRKPVLVRLGSCTYEWRRGLVQGMRFSPILCEIFYNNSDIQNLSEFSKISYEISLFVRFVDDYLFITDNIQSAFSFLNSMIDSGKINPNKTVCNFMFDGIKTCSSISFLGYILDTHTLQVTRDVKVYSGQICFRISFTSGISEPTKFLENRIAQTTVPLTPLFFNLAINTEETLWKNIFITLCISANKFSSIITLIYTDTTNFDAEQVFSVYKRKVAVRMCDLIVKRIVDHKPDILNFDFCINHLRFLAYKALSLFSCKSNICSNFNVILKIAMKKTNCSEGLWKPHSKSIDRVGNEIHFAVREVCRTPKIVKYLKEFSEIPKGFEAFLK